jgi:hypothetical protein
MVHLSEVSKMKAYIFNYKIYVHDNMLCIIYRVLLKCVTKPQRRATGFISIVRQCEVTSRKYALKQGNRIGVCFIKYDKLGVFLKCAEILPTRLWDNVED